MNERFHTYLKKAGEEVSLSLDERERMRRTVQSYMEMKPLRAPASPVSVTAFAWFFTPRLTAAVLVLTFFVSSGGISYAAEDSLPGDFLYPVKTHVNEPVQGALSISPSAKAAWAMNVAGERVQEAAALAAEGRLSTSTQQQLQTNFQEHAQVAAQSIGEQATSSPEESAEAAVRFEAQLSEYQNVLVQVGAAKSIDVAPLVAAVKAESDHIATVRASVESHITSAGDQNKAATRMQIAARAQLDASTELARIVSQSLSSSSAQLVSAQLDSASTTISAGKDFTTKHATSDALGAFQNALSATEKLGVFLQTSSNIHAHTGLIVGEPQKVQSRQKTQGIQKGSRGNGTNNQSYIPATTVSAATSTNLGSLQVSTTATNTNKNADSATNTSIQAHVEGQQQAEVPSTPGAPSMPEVPALPLSVPVHISL